MATGVNLNKFNQRVSAPPSALLAPASGAGELPVTS